MPAKIRKVKGGYQVSTPNQVHAKRTTKRKAENQRSLLNAVDHGWKPTGKPARNSTPRPHTKPMAMPHARPSTPRRRRPSRY